MAKLSASVIVLAERAPTDNVSQAIRNVLEQTYDDFEIIVSHFEREDIDQLKEKFPGTQLNIRWVKANDGIALVTDALKLVSGDVVFYKTVNPAEWLPRHIEHHIECYNTQRNSAWSYSLLEMKSLEERGQPLDSVGWRMDRNLKPEQIVLDELSHLTKLIPKWETCVIEHGNNKAFQPGIILDQFKEHKAALPDEITVVQWISTKKPQVVLGQPKSNQNPFEDVVEGPDGQLEVVSEPPTIVGNIQFLRHNQAIWKRLKDKKPEEFKKIAVKRTIGMGDVILVEPVIRKLKQKYPNAEIDFFVGESRGAKEVATLFKSKPNVIPMAGLGEQPITVDYLYDQKGYDLRLDFDLAYESRSNLPYIDGYFRVAGFNDTVVVDESNKLRIAPSVDSREKFPELEFDAPAPIQDKYVSVEILGSGWGGKEWGIENWGKLIRKVRKAGYKIAWSSNFKQPEVWQEGDFVNEKNDFQVMLAVLKNATFHMGADNGPMHVALAFGNRAFIIAGAALPRYTTAGHPLVWEVANRELDCLHCKGRQFYNDNGQGGITFVTRCENQDAFACMKKLSYEVVSEQFDTFLIKT